MRWSRHHEPSSLGELMESPSDEDTPSTPVAGADEDTQVRLWPAGDTGESRTSEQQATPTGPGNIDAAGPGEAGGTDGGASTDDFLDDDDYLPQENRGPGRLTVALVAALVLAVGVLGGVWVEKQLGSGQSSAAARGQGMPGGSAGGRGVPGGSAGGQGMPGGAASGAAGGSGLPGGGASGAPGGSASDGAGTQPGAGDGSGTSATPVVVGTVSSASAKSLVVTDLGGTKHTITVTGSTTVTTPYGHDSLETGDTVAVSGSTGSDGSVTATGLTVS